jgi:hypothetical protein
MHSNLKISGSRYYSQIDASKQTNSTFFSSYYSSFLRVRAIRADRLPAGVITVPVFCSSGVVGSLDRVLTGVVGAAIVGEIVLVVVLLSLRAEILENPKTTKNPNSPIYGGGCGGRRSRER